jgi:ankyrin repeat protein
MMKNPIRLRVTYLGLALVLAVSALQNGYCGNGDSGNPEEIEQDVTGSAPNEMWIGIFQNLSNADLQSVRLANRRFHELAIAARAEKLLKKYRKKLNAKPFVMDDFIVSLAFIQEDLQAIEYFVSSQRADASVELLNQILRMGPRNSYLGRYSNVIQAFLDRGVDINAKDSYNWTIMDSALHTDKHVLEFLLSKGADLKVRADSPVSLHHGNRLDTTRHLLYYVKKGNLAVVRAFFKSGHIDWDSACILDKAEKIATHKEMKELIEGERARRITFGSHFAVSSSCNLM